MSTPQTKILFDDSSASLGPYSLVPFAVQGMTTIVGVGLADDDVITFELMSFAGGRFPSDCECYPIPGKDPELIGVQPLMCPTCESQSPQYVRMTARNPVVILDYPVGPMLRAKYEGSGIGDSKVWLYQDPRQGAEDEIDLRTQDLTDNLRGCPPVCCEDEEQTWEPTGTIMCVADTVMQEERSNCGNLRWTERGPVTWTPTGNFTCGRMTQGGDGFVTYLITREERNDCGDPRWTDDAVETDAATTGNVQCDKDQDNTSIEWRDLCGNTAWFSGPLQDWRDTGEARCTPGSQTGMQKQQVNQCGETRWVNDPANVRVWTDNGVIQCVPGSETDTEKQQVDQCGNLRWVPGPPQVWTDTGATRCSLDNETTEKEQVNQCGNTRWVAGDDQQWVYTGEFRCLNAPTEAYPDGRTELKMVNQCGAIMWVPGPGLTWTDTGDVRCVPDSEEDTEKKQVNNCGDVRWVPGPEQEWSPTGQLYCDGMDDTGETYRLHEYQQNQCGTVRLYSLGDTPWEDTGAVRLVAGTYEKQQRTVCGDTRWVAFEPTELNWVATGSERCTNGVVQQQEVNQYGNLRWVDTTRKCVSPEHFATLPLPGCGGLAYRPGDARDPAATVELQEDCDPPVTIGYLYPEPREGARTPVIAGDCATACPDTTIVGFAVDNPSGGGAGCDGPIRVVVEQADKKAVQLISSCSNDIPDRILWDDGSITLPYSL